MVKSRAPHISDVVLCPAGIHATPVPTDSQRQQKQPAERTNPVKKQILPYIFACIMCVFGFGFPCGFGLRGRIIDMIAASSPFSTLIPCVRASVRACMHACAKIKSTRAPQLNSSIPFTRSFRLLLSHFSDLVQTAKQHMPDITNVHYLCLF